MRFGIPKLWNETPKIVDMANDFFLFKFDVEEDVMLILTNGP